MVKTSLVIAEIAAVLMLVCALKISSASTTYEPTIEKLKAFYAETNRTYFNNELDQNTRITIFNSKEAMGHTDVDADGTPHIYIDKDSHPIEKEAEMTLAHEMCHLKSGSAFDESEEFQGCMIDLAKRGAFKGIW
jgi:hypothetical protein